MQCFKAVAKDEDKLVETKNVFIHAFKLSALPTNSITTPASTIYTHFVSFQKLFSLYFQNKNSQCHQSSPFLTHLSIQNPKGGDPGRLISHFNSLITRNNVQNNIIFTFLFIKKSWSFFCCCWSRYSYLQSSTLHFIYWS